MEQSKLSQLESSSLNDDKMMEDEWYDLLPIEKKLVMYTFGLGIVLLIIFVFTYGVI